MKFWNLEFISSLIWRWKWEYIWGFRAWFCLETLKGDRTFCIEATSSLMDFCPSGSLLIPLSILSRPNRIISNWRIKELPDYRFLWSLSVLCRKRRSIRKGLGTLLKKSKSQEALDDHRTERLQSFMSNLTFSSSTTAICQLHYLRSAPKSFNKVPLTLNFLNVLPSILNLKNWTEVS